jgi:hypothetical protein
MGKKNQRSLLPNEVALWHLAPGTSAWRLVGTYASRSDAWDACRSEPDLFGTWKVLPTSADANAPRDPQLAHAPEDEPVAPAHASG